MCDKGLKEVCAILMGQKPRDPFLRFRDSIMSPSVIPPPLFAKLSNNMALHLSCYFVTFEYDEIFLDRKNSPIPFKETGK